MKNPRALPQVTVALAIGYVCAFSGCASMRRPEGIHEASGPQMHHSTTEKVGGYLGSVARGMIDSLPESGTQF
jgi:hypothetical protein